MYPRLYNSFTQQQRYRYSGYVPLINSTIATTSNVPRNSVVCDFTPNYRERLSTEWSPRGPIQPNPPMMIQSTPIYYSHLGHLPNYGGHIPGQIFRFGKTYGTDTIDAKRWLRGDLST